MNVKRRHRFKSCASRWNIIFPFFYHAENKTNQTNKKSLLTQFKFAILRTFLENFQIAWLWFGCHLIFIFICFRFDCSLKFKTTAKQMQKEPCSWRWARDKIYKHIFFSSAWMRVCLFFFSSVLWLSIALPKMGSMRVSMPRNPIYALIYWASLWCGKLIHIHWNTISSTYYGFLFAFLIFQFMCSCL